MSKQPKFSKHFDLQEFVPPEVYMQFGDNSAWFIQPSIVAVANTLRDLLQAPIIINNWHTGGDYKYRGFRPRSCTVGAPLSMHRMGLAIDVSAKGMLPRQIITRIQVSKELFLPLGLSTIENPAFTPTWVHLDCRPRTARHPEGDFLIVNP